MVPGVDFTERFSPVATDDFLRTQIAINLVFYVISYGTHKDLVLSQLMNSRGRILLSTWCFMLLIMEYITALLESDMDNEMVVEPHPALVACGFLMEAPRRQLANTSTEEVDA